MDGWVGIRLQPQMHSMAPSLGCVKSNKTGRLDGNQCFSLLYFVTYGPEIQHDLEFLCPKSDLWRLTSNAHLVNILIQRRRGHRP